MLRNVLWLVFSVVLLLAVYYRHTMPEEPGFSNVALQDKGFYTNVVSCLALEYADWEVVDCFFFKYARVTSGGNLWLVTTPFSGGQWHR